MLLHPIAPAAAAAAAVTTGGRRGLPPRVGRAGARLVGGVGAAAAGPLEGGGDGRATSHRHARYLADHFKSLEEDTIMIMNTSQSLTSLQA